MTERPQQECPLGIRGLLGLAFDGDGQQTRITRGENFRLYGGSQETHERMVETAVRFNEEVDKRGKPLEEINARDLEEIRHELSEEP